MITLQDLITRFGEEELAELTDRENRQIINNDVIDRAIEDAEGEIEGYLNAVGLVSRNSRGHLIYRNDKKPPKALTLKACDIARYYLHDDGVIDIVQNRYDNAIKWLDKVLKNPKMLTGDESYANAGATVHVIPNPKPSLWVDD